MAHWMQCNFIQTQPPWADSVCTFESGGKGDNAPEGKRHVPFKPTGFLDRPKKAGKVEGRIEESREIQAEIAGRLAREFGEETLRLPSPPPVSQMSLAEIEREIGLILRKKIRTEEDEILLLLFMVAVAA